jgi:hypothetical protein
LHAGGFFMPVSLRVVPAFLTAAIVFEACAASANEKLGFVVRRLTDSCVGTILQSGVIEAVAKAGRTATGICTCAAEVEVASGRFPKEGFDAWAVQPSFKRLLEMCTNSGSH